MSQTAGQPRADLAATALQHVLALLDYDGTATTSECIEVVLQRFVGDAWRTLEDAVRRGDLTHAECLDRQMALVSVPRADLLAAMADAAAPAPGLHELLALARDGGARTTVVSAGFGEVIEEVWRRHDLPPVAVVAGALEGRGHLGGPPYRVRFSDRLGDCRRCGPASCKAAVLRELRRPGDTVLVFGDGESDFCMAREADVVYARARLAELCAVEGVGWRPLDYVAAAADLQRLVHTGPST